MKYLGIDYGTKKIGLAISDIFGNIAFPKEIIKNDNNSIDILVDIIKSEGVEKIIIGKSLKMDGTENILQKDIEKFIEKISHVFDGDIVEQDERMSSISARAHLYGKGNIENERWTTNQNKIRRNPIDAGAAAIILQRYLDKLK
jgi:putative Holliday junction resolvase